MGQLILGQRIQHIALILGRIRCPVQQIPARIGILHDPGIMAGDHTVTAKLFSPAHQLVKFQMTVTVDAGIGGSAALITADEFLDHFLLKISGEVEDIEGKTQPAGNCPGIFHIIQAAAGGFQIFTQNFVVEQPHGHTNAVPVGSLHQIGRNSAVHAAAHGDERFLL